MAKAGPRTPHEWCGDRWLNVHRFRQLTKYNSQSGCEEWQGSLNNAGYGMFGFRTGIDLKTLQGRNGNMMTAHRAAWLIHHRQPIPPGQHVHHICHNIRCVTPHHLKLGVHRDKIQEMMLDHRHGFQLNPNWNRINRENWHRNYDGVRKYTEEEIQWGRQATIEEIQDRYQCDRARARRLRQYLRAGYPWLPYDVKGTRLPRGRRPQS